MSDLPEFELQEVVPALVMGIKLGSSGGGVSTFNHWVMSPALQ